MSIRSGGGSLAPMTFDLGTIAPTSDDARRRAALYVCSHATDIDDARGLLDALGLGGDS